MWDCLVKFSTWAEGNSGQIQIVIAVIALFFAFLGYRKVIKQIDFPLMKDWSFYSFIKNIIKFYSIF